jgi:hypothetical protein
MSTNIDARLQWHGGLEHLVETFQRRVGEQPKNLEAKHAREAALEGVVGSIANAVETTDYTFGNEGADDDVVAKDLCTACGVVQKCLKALESAQATIGNFAALQSRLSGVYDKMCLTVR